MTPGWRQLAVTFVPTNRRGQLVSKEDVGELGLSVDLAGDVLAVGPEVVEIERTLAVHLRRDGDDAGGGGRFQGVEEQVRQEERGEMVDGELGLEAVDGESPLAGDRASVVDKDVELRVLRIDRSRQLADGSLRREVGDEEIDVLAAGVGGDLGLGGLAAFTVSADHDDGGAHASEACRGRLADAGVRARDEADFAGHVRPIHGEAL